jgi:hypothetical protein
MRKLGFVFLASGLLACAHEREAQTAPPPTATAPAPAAAHTVRITGGHQKLLSVREILKKLNDSPRKYAIGTSAAPLTDAERTALAAAYWGNSRGAYVPLVKRDASGATQVIEDEPSPEIAALLSKAEEPFQHHDFAGAEAIYAQVLARDPHDYHALVAHAECEAYQGRLDQALHGYEDAIAANPYAHVAWEYKGEVLLMQRRREDALDAYAHALALKPRWGPLVTHIKNRAEVLGVTVAPERLLPAVRITRTDEATRIELDPRRPEWLGFGACKALWLDDPEHRREVTGSTEHHHNSAEERECVVALLDGYNGLHKDGKANDPALDEALEIVKAGAIDELLAYEVLSRADENLAAQLPPDLLEKLVAYVRWYVLVDRRVSVR